MSPTAQPRIAYAAANPSFVQQASAHRPGATSLAVTPPAAITSGDRLVVEVGMWSPIGSTAASVIDSAGNHYVEVLRFEASDATEMSVWTAPITAGDGTRPTVTVQPTSSADTGMAVLEYAGRSTVADATVVDQMAHTFGTTGGAAAVASGATAPTAAGHELAVGVYVDSGFGDALTADPTYTLRTRVSTGAQTTWLMATLVFKPGGGGP